MITCDALPAFSPYTCSMACSILDVSDRARVEFENLTLRAAGSAASFLANRFGLARRSSIAAFAPAFTMASSVAPSDRTYAGAVFGTENSSTLCAGCVRLIDSVLRHGDDLAAPRRADRR